MTNYEKAVKLLNMGKAKKHFTYDKTGIITIDLGDNRCGYADGDKEYIEVAVNNSIAWYGNISDDLETVIGTRHNREVVIV